MQLLKRLDQHVLRHFLRFGVIAQTLHANDVDHPLEPTGQFAKRFVLATLSRANQLFVACLYEFSKWEM